MAHLIRFREVTERGRVRALTHSSTVRATLFLLKRRLAFERATAIVFLHSLALSGRVSALMFGVPLAGRLESLQPDPLDISYSAHHTGL